MPWECDRCHTVHNANLGQCRSCGHSVFSPISHDDVAERSEGVQSPEPMDAGSIGTTAGSGNADFTGSRSPDVALDGSMKTESVSESDVVESNSGGLLSSIRSAIRSLV